MAPLRLLHIFPTFGIGGAQLRVAAIMNSLGTSATHTVVALDGNFEAAGRVNVELRAVDPPAGKGSAFYATALRRSIRDVKPDVLLTYNWGAMDAVIAAAFGRLCPVIHNECGFGPEEAAGLKARRVWVRRVVLNRIFQTVVVSSALRAIALTQFNLRPSKVRFIRTGVDTERFQPGRNQDWRARHAIEENTALFGFVGGLRPEKNLELLLRGFAAAQLPDARLALVGEGPCRVKLERLAQELGIGPKVIFEGQVADTAACLAAFDVFVMSSVTEQTSNALLEAMACGLPAVATDVGDTGEILAQREWPAVVQPDDLQGYAARLREMAARPQLRETVGSANRRRVLSDYSFERMTREYAELYFSAAGRLPIAPLEAPCPTAGR